jgi:hypothetical protein
MYSYSKTQPCKSGSQAITPRRYFQIAPIPDVTSLNDCLCLACLEAKETTRALCRMDGAENCARASSTGEH